MRQVRDLKVGDTVTIRRTSGAAQIATVRWVIPSDIPYAPETVVFGVEFMENGVLKYKNCRASYLLA